MRQHGPTSSGTSSSITSIPAAAPPLRPAHTCSGSALLRRGTIAAAPPSPPCWSPCAPWRMACTPTPTAAPRCS
eukprot:1161090-Pelagomonas_calceolata.AAC.8